MSREKIRAHWGFRLLQACLPMPLADEIMDHDAVDDNDALDDFMIESE